jgi:glycosyltransferase involved in cell wall biosynthesis
MTARNAAYDNGPLSVSVVIPVHNGGAYLRRCLASLARCAPPPHETIVVDDGSTDDSPTIAARLGATVLSTEARQGPAHARNLGVHAAEGSVVLFLDADVAVDEHIVGAVSEVFARDAGLAALFGSYDDEPAATNFLSQYKNLLHHYMHQTAREEAFTFWTGCGAIRREIFLELGGLDERFSRPAIEDIELGYRLRRAGHRILLLKNLQVKHLKPWHPIELVRTDFVRRALPWSDLILRHRRFDNDLNIGWTSRLSVVAAGVLIAALVAACFWPPLLALAGASSAALVLLNGPFYRFILLRRGPLFLLRSLLWNWLYYLYSGVAFGVAVMRYLTRGLRHQQTGGRPVAASADRGMVASRPSGPTTQ